MTTWGRRESVAISAGIVDFRQAGDDDGVPVVLLHGFPETSLSWGEVARHLAATGLRLIAPDQRGYSPGARPEGVEHYGVDMLADDVVELADALGLDTFHLVGHDWGASVAWVVAASQPHRLRSLTAVSVPHLAAFGQALRSSPDQQRRSAYMQLFRVPGKAEDVLLADGAARLIGMYQGQVPEADVAAYVELLSEPGALTAALNYYRAMTAEMSQLPAVAVPTTYVWSSGDMALGREGAERCGDFVTADYRFVELPDVTHWIPDQAPAALAEAIVERVQADLRA